MKVIGYIRVSTDKQAQEGYGLDAQVDEIRRWCQGHSHELVTVIPDVMSSRKTHALHGRLASISAVRGGLADAVLIRAVDRVTRSVLDGALLLQQCIKAGVRLVSIDGADTANEETQLTTNVKIAVAQEQRRLISRTTREALAALKAKGVPLGRPSTVPDEVKARIVRERDEEGRTFAEIATGLDADGVPTRRGASEWRKAAVRDVYIRATAQPNQQPEEGTS